MFNHIVNFVSDPIPNKRTEFSKHPSRNPIHILKYLIAAQWSRHWCPGDPLSERALYLPSLCSYDFFGLESEFQHQLRWLLHRQRDRTNEGSSAGAGYLVSGGGLVFLDPSHWRNLRHQGNQWTSHLSLPSQSLSPFVNANTFYGLVWPSLTTASGLPGEPHPHSSWFSRFGVRP